MVDRLMRVLGLIGAVRGTRVRTMMPAKDGIRVSDLTPLRVRMGGGIAPATAGYFRRGGSFTTTRGGNIGPRGSPCT